MRIKDD